MKNNVIKIEFFINLKSFRLFGNPTVWEMFPLFSTVIYFLVDADVTTADVPTFRRHDRQWIVEQSLRQLLRFNRPKSE